MKQKIISILNDHEDGIFIDKSDTISDAIMKLLPRKRYPATDGWPKPGTNCLIDSTIEERIVTAVWQDNNRFYDGVWGIAASQVTWYIPVSELLDMLGGGE